MGDTLGTQGFSPRCGDILGGGGGNWGARGEVRKGCFLEPRLYHNATSRRASRALSHSTYDIFMKLKLIKNGLAKSLKRDTDFLEDLTTGYEAFSSSSPQFFMRNIWFRYFLIIIINRFICCSKHEPQDFIIIMLKQTVKPRTGSRGPSLLPSRSSSGSSLGGQGPLRAAAGPSTPSGSPSSSVLSSFSGKVGLVCPSRPPCFLSQGREPAFRVLCHSVGWRSPPFL